ncbi:carboxymuconolactone decarboxylase family protein [Kribbella sp. NPDC051586]|uniref:carboxymuconolactone decarboxylase family protein n=1 Tax=Kribbella sp. NPDC051586 TaxID=3364118 RepID=UPI003794884C
MNNYQIHTPGTAAEPAKETLQVLQDAFGFVPAVAGVMANSVPLLSTFFAAFGQFRGFGTFGADERQVLLLSNAVANRSEWAVAFHTLESLADGVEPDVVEALRRGELPDDPRMAALSRLTRAMIEKRGHVDDTDVADFTAAGFTDEQVLEAIIGVAVSTMTNYTGNLARPELEEAVAPHAWKPEYSTGG